jgi:hypothetical protein
MCRQADRNKDLFPGSLEVEQDVGQAPIHLEQNCEYPDYFRKRVRLHSSRIAVADALVGLVESTIVLVLAVQTLGGCDRNFGTRHHAAGEKADDVVSDSVKHEKIPRLEK